MSVVTTGPTYRLQLKLDRADAAIEAEMAKSRFDALGLAPNCAVMLRLEFGLFAAPQAESAAVPEPPALDSPVTGGVIRRGDRGARLER